MSLQEVVFAAAEQYVSDRVATETAQLRDELFEMEGRLVETEQLVTELQTQLAESRAIIARLEERIRELEGDEPPEQFVVYGSSRKNDPDETVPNKHRRYAAMLPGVPSYRKYFTQGLKLWNDDADLRFLAANEPSLKRVVLSFKGSGTIQVGSVTKNNWTDAELEAFVPTIPEHIEVVLCWHHEPNDNWTGAEQRAVFRQRYAALVAKVRQINHPRLKLSQILVGWFHAEWREFYVPGLDYFGFDRYNPTRSGRYNDPATLLQPLWEAYLQTDAPGFILGETGTDVLNNDPEGARAWAQSLVQFFNERASQVHGSQREAIHCLWWDAIGHPPDPIINDTRLREQPRTLEIWQAAVAESARKLG